MKCLTSLNTRMIRRIFVISINLRRTHFMLSELKQLFRCLYCADQNALILTCVYPYSSNQNPFFYQTNAVFGLGLSKIGFILLKRVVLWYFFFFYSFHPSARVTHSCRMLLCRLAVARLIGCCHRLLKFRERDIFAFMSWLEF